MRRLADLSVTILTAVCASACIGLLIVIIGTIAWRGASAVSWNFLTEQMRLAGASGGIFYNILGTLILLGTALTVSAPIAFGAALAHGVYLKSPRSRERLMMGLHVMNGVPSILFGLFGLMVFVLFLGWGKSWLTGGLMLGMMMLPTVAVSLSERIQTLPHSTIEAATALGLNQSQIVWSVILPQSFGGWMSGSLLGMARAAGETAPIMFTATIFAGATIPPGIRESPVLSLPYHIFILAQDSFDPAVGAKLWGAALVLLLLVFFFSLAALPLRLKLQNAAHDG